MRHALDESSLPKGILAYRIAQSAMADLKTAVYLLFSAGGGAGYTNAEVGRNLGIYAGHVGHEGHISRTLLGLLEGEGLLKQNTDTKKWVLKQTVTQSATDLDIEHSEH